MDLSLSISYANGSEWSGPYARFPDYIEIMINMKSDARSYKIRMDMIPMEESMQGKYEFTFKMSDDFSKSRMPNIDHFKVDVVFSKYVP